MNSEGLDDFDKKIIDVLKQNARLSYSEIGERVGLSRVSVKNRMDILEENNIIRGYVPVLNVTNVPEGKRFILDVETEPDKFDEAVDGIAKHPVIRKVYAMTGNSRFMAEGFASYNLSYENFMRNLKSALVGVRNISIHDVQYRIKDVDGGMEYISLDERKIQNEGANGKEYLA